ncbi:MAG: hypothetical protein EWV79_09730 [Microcystis aeruginosa Ma_MB_S_20031200_S102D]|nr:MAG: hypothetical protein EWV79_09730 [Microcystis aeruginosa Ma_MB_S_20031200_S102D]
MVLRSLPLPFRFPPQHPPPRLPQRQSRFSGSLLAVSLPNLRIRENSLTLFPFSPFTLIPYFFSYRIDHGHN